MIRKKYRRAPAGRFKGSNNSLSIHSQRRQYGRKPFMTINEKIASYFDFSSLLSDENSFIPVNEQGYLVLDPNNPIHRMWLED